MSFLGRKALISLAFGPFVRVPGLLHFTLDTSTYLLMLSVKQGGIK